MPTNDNASVGTSHMRDIWQMSVAMQWLVGYHGNDINKPLHSNGHLPNITHVGGSHNCG
jgi:hypothetical protein